MLFQQTFFASKTLQDENLQNEHEMSPAEFDSSELEQMVTPAMLAEMLHVSVRLVRRWHRAGLLKSTKEVMQLPYFGYSEIATAKQLAQWTSQGVSFHSLQSQLEAIQKRVGGSGSLESLPIVADGKRLVLREGDSFIESGGQFRFGFELTGDEDNEAPQTLRFTPRGVAEKDREIAPAAIYDTFEDIIEAAIAAEDEDDLEGAIDLYRSALSAYGPSPDVCFQLAEVLYRLGDLTAARERYFVALELDPQLVEARANLGCVLAECGQLDLAIAAFEGTLSQFEAYADVHFHLARALDDRGLSSRALDHWRRFLELAPTSPWAEEAEQRLVQGAPLLDF